jgi:transcriptional antiterminator RfaH
LSNTLNSLPKWRVIKTKPHQECAVAKRLKHKHFDVYVPLMQKKTYTFGKLLNRIQPLFPQYIFARFETDESFSDIRWTAGIKGVICFNGKPAIIPDEVIDFLQNQEDHQGIVRKTNTFKPDQRVAVRYGLLKNLQGLFVKELTGPDRVLILMSIMGCTTYVQIDSAMLKAV